MASTSLTPPIRQASIWQTSIASAWKSCLKMTRFWTCSPVATPIGRDLAPDARVAEDVVGARRLLDPPRVELRRARRMAAIASSTPQTWFASIISTPSGAERARISAGAARVRGEVVARPSSSRGRSRRRPPRARAARPSRRRSRASRPRSCTPDSPTRTSSRSPLVAPRRASRSRSSASSGGERVVDVAEVDRTRRSPRASGRRAAATAACPRLRPQVPDRVDDRGGGEMDHALLRPEPAELAVGGEAAPEARASRE